VVAPLLKVLHSLHQLGIIHRDIKPENIFFEADGTLRLGDFGLAINATKERPISRVGTLDYMAPEGESTPHTPKTGLWAGYCDSGRDGRAGLGWAVLPYAQVMPGNTESDVQSSFIREHELHAGLEMGWPRLQPPTQLAWLCWAVLGWAE